jgi:hypothetical protein
MQQCFIVCLMPATAPPKRAGAVWSASVSPIPDAMKQ